MYEGAAEFDGEGEVVVDEFFAELEFGCGRSGEGAVGSPKYVGSMNEAIGADDFFVGRAPYK